MATKGFWQVEFKVNIDGQDVDFEDLSVEMQNYIIQEIWDGCTSGEILVDNF